MIKSNVLACRVKWYLLGGNRTDRPIGSKQLNFSMLGVTWLIYYLTYDVVYEICVFMYDPTIENMVLMETYSRRS